jgi:hypothetical protein
LIQVTYVVVELSSEVSTVHVNIKNLILANGIYNVSKHFETTHMSISMFIFVYDVTVVDLL